MSCDNCLYEDYKDGERKCKRYPPVPMITFAELTMVYPTVDGRDHCGEYKDRHEGQPDTWR